MNGWAAMAGAGVLAGAAMFGWPPPSSRQEQGWREIPWPFPRDAFPAGLAFHCEGCGGGLEVYVRPKLGFCNCGAGVTDDNEVDGVADLDMISADFVPEQAGEPVTVGGMAGRARRYRLRFADGSSRPAAGLALSRRCDLVAAASQGPGAWSAEGARAVSMLLETEKVAGWIRARLAKG